MAAGGRDRRRPKVAIVDSRRPRSTSAKGRDQCGHPSKFAIGGGRTRVKNVQNGQTDFFACR